MGMNRIGANPRLAGLLSRAVTMEVKPVTEAVTDSLMEAYSVRYVKPTGNSAAIDELVNVFYDLMGHCTTEIREGIGEYYRILTNRQLPAFEWILEAFHVANKKEDSKRNFPYVVGMLRSWMKYGFGHIPSREEEEVVSYFEEVTGTVITMQTRLCLQNLMGMYGAIRVTRMIGGLGTDRDMIMAQALRLSLEEKFPKGMAMSR